MKKLIIYIHGQGGNAEEASHYKSLFTDCDVMGFDYTSQYPWEAKEEFQRYFDSMSEKYESVYLIANSIGAFFAMCSLSGKKIETAYFISPVADMKKLIENMMLWANVSEAELREKGEIETSFGQVLSWKYLSYVRENPINWDIPTHILYGAEDNLISYEMISDFTEKTKSTLTVMENGEHWFHTEEQMNFLDKWIKSFS